MQNKKSGVLELIIFIASVLLIFAVNNFLGLILAIISLIISIVKLKNKHVLTIISLIGSSMLIIYSIIAFILSFNVINDILNNAKENNDKENQIETNTNCLNDLCYELYDGYFVDEKDNDFVTIKYEDDSSYCYYSFNVEQNKYKDSVEYFRNMSWLNEYEITEKQIANSNFSYISYYENNNMRTDLLAIIYNNKLYTITVAMGNQNKNYNNCMDGYNYMMHKIYIKK